VENVHNMNEVEVLLVEDNPSDAELTLRALKQCKIARRLGSCSTPTTTG
jgi:hypothetical protein